MAQGAYGIWTEADFDRDGKQFAWLRMSYSDTRAAYGVVEVPIVVVRNGNGPSVLLMAGNHGDEYEGQVTLSRLARLLEPGDINGCVIILPAANAPAVMAGTRRSPIDNGNLNQAFPGRHDGTPTDQIADFVETRLLPRVQAWIDLHSGGSSLDMLPFASIHLSGDAGMDRRNMAALRAFGAPVGVCYHYQNERAASSAAQRHGVVYLYGEFGGGGDVDPAGVAITYDGTLRLLAHLGALRPSAKLAVVPAAPMRILQVGYDNYLHNRRHYVFAGAAGLFEPLRRLGDELRAGDVLGCIHFMDDPAREPTVARVEVGGVLVCKCHLGRVQHGDCLGHVATDFRFES
jgi:predicted deacylase